MSETRYSSVTSLTGLLPKNLVWWAGNAVADCAFNKQDEWKHLPTKEERIDYVKRAHQRIKDKAADLGSEVHRFVEAMNLGQPMPTWPLPVRARMQHFAQFVEDFSPRIEAAECKVYHRRGGLHYAGTADMFCEIGGEMSILDIKTGKSVWPEAGIQLNLYAHADFLIADPHNPGAQQVNKRGQGRFYTWSGPADDEIPVPKVTKGYVLHLRDDGYDLVPVPISDELYEMGLSLFAVDRWERDLKKRVLGTPIGGSRDALADQAIREFGERAA